MNNIGIRYNSTTQQSEWSVRGTDSCNPFKKATLLGTCLGNSAVGGANTFDVKPVYANWANLKTSDFINGVTSTNHYENGYHLTTWTFSYNATTGILTITPSYNSSAWLYVTFNIIIVA